ncbi:hypothetical protein AFGD_003365 [Aspergillus flavus]|nr:hypothetical protein AFGD_003365 [Aspergillus flavus]
MESHLPGYNEYLIWYSDMSIPTTEISDDPVAAGDPFAFPDLEVQSTMIKNSHQGITSPEDAHQSP